MKRKILNNTQNGNIIMQSRDLRGSRSKFWFYFKNNPTTKWLFKNTNVDDTNKVKTFEDIGECVFYEICKIIKLPCAYYHLAVNHTETIDIEGVITKNFNPFNLTELSGYTLLDFYKNYIYDNYNGKFINLENTLLNYEKSLKCFASINGEVKIDIYNIMMNLKKMFIIDYLCAQSDRNWYNISFLLDENKKILKLAPLYDNGNIFCWNHRVSLLKHQYLVLKNNYKVNYMRDLLKSKFIALGIKSPTSMIDPNNPKRSIKMKQTEKSMDALDNELVDMICESEELQKFLFDNFYPNNDILDKAFEKANKKYQDIPQILYNQSILIYKLRCKYLCEKVVTKLKQQQSLLKGDQDEVSI